MICRASFRSIDTNMLGAIELVTAALDGMVTRKFEGALKRPLGMDSGLNDLGNGQMPAGRRAGSRRLYWSESEACDRRSG